MSLESLWKRFHDLFFECRDSKIDFYETKQLSGRFWLILWRLKDDISSIHKLALNLNEFIDGFYLINSYKSILAAQVLAIIQFYKGNLFNRVFENFITLVESNETYVNHIIYKNRMDSNALWIGKQGPVIFPKSASLLRDCEEIWRILSNPQLFNDFSENAAIEKSKELYNYFGMVAQFADGIEGYVDRLFEGSKRGEFSQNYLEPSEFKINLKELNDQIQFVNDLYKGHFFDVIPFKIRLILEYIIKKIVKWKNPSAKSGTFNEYIKELVNLFPIKKNTFPNQFDINRLNTIREWGNLSAHDIFPATSKEELDDKKKWIIRLIKNLIKINQNLF